MAIKRLSVVVVASQTPGAVPDTGGTGGKWEAGPVQETSYSTLTVGGVHVIHRAQCTFSFTGTSGAAPGDVTGTSTVQLVESGTSLQGGSTAVLVAGDSESDSWNNTVSVTASGPLQSDQS